MTKKFNVLHELYVTRRALQAVIASLPEDHPDHQAACTQLRYVEAQRIRALEGRA